MEVTSGADVQEKTRRKIKWTMEMNDAVLNCKHKARILVKSDEAPLSDSGRKKGYMQVMKEMWDAMGYEDFGLTSQNLRDQAARLERSMGDAASSIIRRIGKRKQNGLIDSNNGESEQRDGKCQSARNANKQEQESNLHSTQDQTVIPVGPVNTLTEEKDDLLEKALRLFASVNLQPGDYTSSGFDTRIKEKPSVNEINIINKTVGEIMSQNTVLPVENPFGYLWVANCALYSAVIAFLLIKGWRKEHTMRTDSGKRHSDKYKREFEKKVTEMRKRISIAKAELERIREN